MSVVVSYLLNLPSWCPVVAYAVLFLPQRLCEILERLVTLLNPLYKGRISPIYGVAQYGDKPRLWYVVLYPGWSLRAVEVQRRGFPYGLLVSDPSETAPGRYLCQLRICGSCSSRRWVRGSQASYPP